MEPAAITQLAISYSADDDKAIDARSRCEEIGVAARDLDARPLSERVRLSRGTLLKLPVVAIGYAALVILTAWLVASPAETPTLWRLSAAFVPLTLLLAFLFETLDAAAGMGFGTALAPLLFALGYDPLEVVPVLLLSESVTGLVSAAIHHEFRNVRFSFRGPKNEATKLMFLIAGVGVASILASVTLTYFALRLPQPIIKTYVALLVLLMGVAAIVRRFRNQESVYRPKRMIAFAAWAGVNKGIGGGGYGPVVTLGQIYSGVYEKSAAAITSLAEGLVSIAGIIAFFALSAAGVDLDFRLLPSVIAGSVLAAILSPYLVRVLPNKILAYLIPGYASMLAVILIIELAG